MRNVFGALMAVLVTVTAHAQCKTYTKKTVMPLLEDFTHNGQYSGAVMYEGEEATLVQTFYSHQNYRLIVALEESISALGYFEILDYKGQLVYSSKDKKTNKFDFNVESTQQLKVRVVVTKTTANIELRKSGCASILVGFKEN